MSAIVIDNDLIQIDFTLETSLKKIRDEISDALLSAKINKAFNKDVNLSFGKVHINPYGSASAISFNGVDILDLDEFIFNQVLDIDHENYVDLRTYLKEHTNEFSFYPIEHNNKIYFTLLKSSEYFYNKFGNIIHDHSHFKVLYTLKYIVFQIRENDKWSNYVFVIDLFNSEHVNRLILFDSIRNVGLYSNLYYCFSKTRPEVLLRLGQIRSNFKAYKAIAEAGFAAFYKGNNYKLILKLFRQVDAKNEPLVFASRRKIAEIIILASYSNVKDFADEKGINYRSLRRYLSGSSEEILYSNGDELTSKRLLELLNVQTQIEKKDLLASSLLTEVAYEEIPEVLYDIEQ